MMWWELAGGVLSVVPAYFSVYWVSTGIERLYHEWVMQRTDRKRAWLERLTAAPLEPAPSPWTMPNGAVVLPAGWSYTPVNQTPSTERELKNTREALKKLQSEVEQLRRIGNNVTVTKRAGVPATTPHVEDDPKWRWDDGKWVLRTAKEMAAFEAERIRTQQQIIAAQGIPSHVLGTPKSKTRYLRPGEWASND
jgi:hypothetical protein